VSRNACWLLPVTLRCHQVGFDSFGTDLPEDVSQEALLQVVAAYNADPKVRRVVTTGAASWAVWAV
jgi:hypothetical protein